MGVIVWCLDGIELSPSLPVWATGEETEVDVREELYALHVLNLFVEGQRSAEGEERKCTLRPKWNTRWQEVGRRPLKLTPGLCAGMASAIDPARDGGEASHVPPEGPQTTQIYYGRGGQQSQLGLRPTALCYITVQTARVNWLQPNKKANTDNSLVHNKLNRHILRMKTLGRASTAECCQISV